LIPTAFISISESPGAPGPVRLVSVRLRTADRADDAGRVRESRCVTRHARRRLPLCMRAASHPGQGRSA